MKSNFGLIAGMTVFILALCLSPKRIASQSWHINGVNDHNKHEVEQIVLSLDKVSEVYVDSSTKTLSVIPKPRAIVDTQEILEALKLAPEVSLGAKLSNKPLANQNLGRKYEIPKQYVDSD